ncbi:MAG: GYD domain-containing protein [bacterium]
MATYIPLMTFTEEGARSLGKSTARAEAFAKVAEKQGIKIIDTFWTNGPYDVIHIFEVNKEEDAMAHSYSLSTLGNVKTQTYRAYRKEEIDPVMKSIFNPFDLLNAE